MMNCVAGCIYIKGYYAPNDMYQLTLWANEDDPGSHLLAPSVGSCGWGICELVWGGRVNKSVPSEPYSKEPST